jgi:aspartate 1-decarboxylase
MLGSKIHRATVTGADPDYEGSVTIDTTLMAEADIVPYQAVAVWDIDNGNRFETYAIPGAPDSGTICVNGAAARLVSQGDLVIIVSFIELDEAELDAHAPLTVFVDEANRATGSRLEVPGPGTPPV